MTTKTWRLVVTPLSGTTSLHQLEVEAPNWMGALREARKEMGEDGGLPVGASCAVAPDGTVTILDSESRRKFLLTPRSGSASGGPKTAEPVASPTPSNRNGQPPPPAGRRREFQTISYEPPRKSAATHAVAVGSPASTPAATPAPAPAPRPDLEVLFTRDEEPGADNPLTYRERAYLIPKGTTVREAEAALRSSLAVLQGQLEAIPRGKFINLAAFDHRWVDQPKRPPLVVLEWRDWRGEPAVDYPADEGASSSSTSSARAEPDDRLTSVFEALHDLAHLRTPAEGLEFIVELLKTTVPAEAIAAALYDINTDELRFVALTGPGADELRGTAIPRSGGLFGRAGRTEHTALVIRELIDEPEYDPKSDGRPGLEVQNMLLRPVVHDQSLLAMLQLINRTTGAFSAPDVHLVNYAADRLAEFLKDARARVRH